jgi:hypothetical protein
MNTVAKIFILLLNSWAVSVDAELCITTPNTAPNSIAIKICPVRLLKKGFLEVWFDSIGCLKINLKVFSSLKY